MAIELNPKEVRTLLNLMSKVIYHHQDEEDFVDKLKEEHDFSLREYEDTARWLHFLENKGINIMDYSALFAKLAIFLNEDIYENWDFYREESQKNKDFFRRMDSKMYFEFWDKTRRNDVLGLLEVLEEQKLTKEQGLTEEKIRKLAKQIYKMNDQTFLQYKAEFEAGARAEKDEDEN